MTPKIAVCITTHNRYDILLQGIYHFGQNAGIDWFFVWVGRHVSRVNMGATGASHIPNTPAAVARGNTYCQPLTRDESRRAI